MLISRGTAEYLGPCQHQHAMHIAAVSHAPCVRYPLRNRTRQCRRNSVLPAQAAAAKVGEVLAARAGKAAVPAVHWERKRRQKYHGKIAALLQSMQAGGLPLH